MKRMKIDNTKAFSAGCVCQPQGGYNRVIPITCSSAVFIMMFPGCLMKLQEPGVVLMLEALWGFGTGMVLMC